MPVNASALTTRQAVLDYLELSSVTTAQATVMDRMINGVTAWVQNETGRKFKKKAASDMGSYNPTDTPDDAIYDGNGTQYLFLNQYPVATVATLQTVHSIVDGIKDSSTINSDNYRLNKRDGIITLVAGVFNERSQNVEVNFRAGFGTIPADLQLAAEELVAIQWRKKSRDTSIKREELDEARFEYHNVFTGKDARAIPDWVHGIIENYRRLQI